jgi:hypothetical protein
MLGLGRIRRRPLRRAHRTVFRVPALLRGFGAARPASARDSFFACRWSVQSGTRSHARRLPTPAARQPLSRHLFRSPERRRLSAPPPRRSEGRTLRGYLFTLLGWTGQASRDGSDFRRCFCGLHLLHLRQKYERRCLTSRSWASINNCYHQSEFSGLLARRIPWLKRSALFGSLARTSAKSDAPKGQFTPAQGNAMGKQSPKLRPLGAP